MLPRCKKRFQPDDPSNTVQECCSVHIPDDREHQFRLIANSVTIDPEQCSGASRTRKIQTI